MRTEQKINLTIVGFSLLALLIVVFLVFPFFQNIQETSRAIKSQKEKYLALESQIQGLEQFKVLYQDLAVFLAKVDRLFVDAEVPVDFITFLEEKAAESSLTISISPSTAGRGTVADWSSLRFQMNLKGSFTNVVKFLEKLENSPYLIEIRNLTAAKADEVGQVKTSLVIEVYAK